MEAAPLSVVEVSPFPAAANGVWSDAERMEFIDYIARNPEAGAVIPGTGGVRKVRWSRTGMGKRGGARVIYYYHSTALPIFLLTVYAKSEAENLTKAGCQEMAEVVAILIEQYRRRK